MLVVVRTVTRPISLIVAAVTSVRPVAMTICRLQLLLRHLC